MNQSEIAEIFSIGRMTLYRHLEANACTTTVLTFASSRPRC
ncbi:helix-turn-helix domain-containing protein [Rhodococcus pyridinivorans]|nr:helix-turn-helix domain-containing protein [Rhodococcus pyridinivorans]